MSLNVIPLLPQEAGLCGICGGVYTTQHVALSFIDQPTKIKVGKCCVIELKRADHALTWHGRRFGITHPDSFPL